jgi:hypothetical protein
MFQLFPHPHPSFQFFPLFFIALIFLLLLSIFKVNFEAQFFLLLHHRFLLLWLQTSVNFSYSQLPSWPFLQPTFSLSILISSYLPKIMLHAFPFAS